MHKRNYNKLKNSLVSYDSPARNTTDNLLHEPQAQISADIVIPVQPELTVRMAGL